MYQQFVCFTLEDESLPSIYYIVGADNHLKKEMYHLGGNLYSHLPNLGKVCDTLVSKGILSKTFDYAIPRNWADDEYKKMGVFPRAVWEYPETGEYHFGGRPRYYSELETEYKNVLLSAKIKSVELEK